MEEQIKKTAARVRTTFAYFWMLPILLVLLGETGGGLVGMYAGDVRATYMAETVTILLAASCVPIALKLFSWVLIRKIDVVTLPEALRLYALWSGVRLALLAIFHFMLQRHDGIAERFHHCRILAEQVKNQPHSRLASHSGQLGKLIYRLLQ